MKAFLLSLLLGFSFLSPYESSSPQCNLRVMDVRELTLQADIIARVKVKKDKRIKDPMFGQVVTLDVVDLIKGDPRLKEVKVLAMSKIYCAMDNYVTGQEFLVFLVLDRTFYRTLNFQYGQFLVDGMVIKDWRTPNNGHNPPQGSRPYDQIKDEIRDIMTSFRPVAETANP